MNKAHHNKNWKNKPSIDTPLNQTNLNELDLSVDTIDDRVISLDVSKANQTDMLQTISNITFAKSTGVFTITRFNGSSYTIDTDLEKIAINFDYDDDPSSAHYQQLILTLIDGTVKYIDLSALITQFEFIDSGTIHFSVDSSGKVSASIKSGSITEDMLYPNFLADCRLEVNKATQQANLADIYRKRSEAYATGKIDGSDVPSTDEAHDNNAAFYSKESEAWARGTKDNVPVGPSDKQSNNSSKFYSEVSAALTEEAKGYIDVAEDLLNETIAKAADGIFTVNFETGNLEYSNMAAYNFTVNSTTGNLEWEVV